MGNIKEKILEIDLKNRSNKILGVGLPKTGTTSLNESLKILGYRSLHSPCPYAYAQCLGIQIYKWEEVVSRIFHTEEMLKKFPVLKYTKKDIKFKDWDAMVNFGEHTYPILDKSFPNSKFILTIRDKEPWLKSAKNIVSKWGNGFLNLTRRVHIFHCAYYDEEYFSLLYDTHLRNVKYYFKDRMQDLLIINVCGGEGWEKLCPFLNKDIPDVPFPHKNKTKYN